MQIAEKANILTQNKPLVLDYNVLTNALTFSISWGRSLAARAIFS